MILNHSSNDGGICVLAAGEGRWTFAKWSTDRSRCHRCSMGPQNQQRQRERGKMLAQSSDDHFVMMLFRVLCSQFLYPHTLTIYRLPWVFTLLRLLFVFTQLASSPSRKQEMLNLSHTTEVLMVVGAAAIDANPNRQQHVLITSDTNPSLFSWWTRDANKSPFSQHPSLSVMHRGWCRQHFILHLRVRPRLWPLSEDLRTQLVRQVCFKFRKAILHTRNG